MKSQVAIVKCESYSQEQVLNSLKEAIGLLGGLEKFILPGNKVLIKPCMVKASSPDEGINTHPEFVRGVIRFVKQLGAIILVGDSHVGLQKSKDVYHISGIDSVCKQEDVELVTFSESYMCNGIPISKYVKEADVIISLPKFKTHGLTKLTCAVKSMFGVVPGLYKMECHKRFPKIEDFSNLLVDIFSYAKPHLVFVDAIISMQGNGPITGGLRDTKLIFASNDAVSLDAVLAVMMNIDAFDVLTTKYAHERYLGVGDIAQIDILGQQLQNIVLKDFKLPVAKTIFDLPQPILKLVGKHLFDFKLRVNFKKCTLCGKCIDICPVCTIEEKKGKITIDGRKCKMCLCCVELCPQNAIYAYKGLLIELLDQLKIIRNWFKF